MGVFDGLLNFYTTYIKWPFATLKLSDILEIIIFSYLIYHLILWITKSKAWIILKGFIAIVAIYFFAEILELQNIKYIFQNATTYVVLGLIIIFQPELRGALERLGNKTYFSKFNMFGEGRDRPLRFSEETLEAIYNASIALGKAKTGALIVIEQNIALDDIISTGIQLDAMISAALLIQIFEHNTPLHDGAVIIRGNRIVAATCYLPLSENMSISKELGTRHRAGLGISEGTDSVTIIASEETGAISIASNGNLIRNVNEKRLRQQLELAQRKSKTKGQEEYEEKN